MGLLDDAIREHLELKRRRGADPSEVERAERDALGPVRRAPEELEHDQAVPEALAPEADDYGDEYEAESAGHYVQDFAPSEDLTEQDLAQPPAYEEPAHSPTEYDLDEAAHPLQDPDLVGYEAAAPEYEPPEPEPEPEPPAPAHEPPAPEYEPHAPVQESPPYDDAVEAEHPLPHPAPGVESHELADVDRETAEYDVESEPEPEGEDVLEETPEFLQDAPEHDRLWFEQRPPRDFDFDG